ncbi:MAG: hypothetical protein KAS59_08665 [Alphaproteobacteria bacterium]|nr:hypothetical protein [Alphaproteobacteria bacterium]MCK5555887.1 hypothetical protein [Alphaproteobacteria bacterium]
MTNTRKITKQKLSNMQHNPSARGNALFLILIVIILFAALSFALTQNFRGIDNTTAEEKARLTATELLQYGNGIRPIIDRMMLLDDVSDINTSGNGILFSATGANADYGVPGAQPATELFHVAGGRASYQTPAPDTCISSCAYEFSGQYTVTGVGIDSNPELVMLVINITQAVCEKTNDLLNTGWSTIPTGGDLTLTRFSGSNYGGANAITLTGGANEFVNKKTFCYQETGGAQRYIYLQVVRKR